MKTHVPGVSAQVRLEADIAERTPGLHVQLKLPSQGVLGEQAADFTHVKRTQLGGELHRMRAAGQQGVEIRLRVLRAELQLLNPQLRSRHVKGAAQLGEIHLRRARLGGEFLNRQVKARIIGPAFERDLHV